MQPNLRIVHFTCGLSPQMGGILSGIEGTCLNMRNNLFKNAIFTFGITKKDSLVLNDRIKRLNDADVEVMSTHSPLRNPYGIGNNYNWRSQIRNDKTPSIFVLHQLYTLSTILGYLLAKREKAPFIVFPHGDLHKYHERRSKFRKILARKLIIDRILKESNAIVATSSGEYQELPNSLMKKCRIIPYSQRVEEIPSTQHLFLSPGRQDKRFLFCSRFDKKKNLPLLLKGFKLALSFDSELKIDIAGSGSRREESQINRLIKKLSIESNVTMHGWISPQKRAELLTQSVAMILPSECENFGLIVSEALSFGIPCIVSEFVGVSSFIDEYSAGIVLPELTPEAIASSIQKILNSNQTLSSTAALNLVTKEFSVSRVEREWKKLFLNLENRSKEKL